MSKELTPREALKRLLNENLKSNEVAKFYDIIEAALGRLEELESAIDLLKTYFFKDRLSFDIRDGISYIVLSMRAMDFYCGIPTNKIKVIKEALK